MQAKRLEYVASLEEDGAIVAEGADRVRPGDAWHPEHLVLVAVAQCTLASLRFYARGVSVSGSAEAAGVISRRGEDGLYAFVEIELVLDIAMDPPPPPGDLGSLLARAERGCFIGNSLTVHPRSVWRVNGAHVEVTA